MTSGLFLMFFMETNQTVRFFSTKAYSFLQRHARPATKSI